MERSFTPTSGPVTARTTAASGGILTRTTSSTRSLWLTIPVERHDRAVLPNLPRATLAVRRLGSLRRHYNFQRPHQSLRYDGVERLAESILSLWPTAEGVAELTPGCRR